MNDFAKALEKIASTFETAFGSTPLNERVADILAQATSIGRYRDVSHLKQETGDMLCSVLQLCNECGWNPIELTQATLEKIESRSEIYRKLGRKLRVGILGGAFDPIHVSHLQTARVALESGQVDEVWIMPCFEHLGGKSMAPTDLRLEMCRIACENIRGVRVFDYEIRHEFRGETYHLVKKLLAEESSQTKFDFSLIIGQDNADSFQSWTNSQGLERLIPFIVIPRQGCQPPEIRSWYLKHPHKFIEPSVRQKETSSSEVRNLIQRGDSRVKDLLPPKVLEFIQEHRLYESASIVRPSENLKIAVYASTFDPPSRFHYEEVKALLQNGFDEVIVYPTGPRPQHGEYEHATPVHRAALLSIAFRNLDRVTVDYTDLSLALFTGAQDLERRFRERGEVWHVVDSTMIAGGSDRSSIVQTRWDEGASMWTNSNFVILDSESDPAKLEDLPVHCLKMPVPRRPTSEELRAKVYRGESIAESVDENVNSYILRHRLFIPGNRQRFANWRLEKPRPLIVYDERNPKSVSMAKLYEKYRSESPNCILVLGGDGTMLKAIREHWTLRVPFVGCNTGHLGFLMNERLPSALEHLELVTYCLPMLRVDFKNADGEQSWGLAYSDVWLERAEGQAAWLRVDVNGETRVNKLVGDGMLIATASGSTAYARAMGAMPVPIDTPTLTLAGSNIFEPRFWKPMILSDDSLITIASLDFSGKRPLRCFMDGIPTGLVQEISVRRSLTASVELAFTKEFDPSARLLRSLFPPETG